MVLAVWWLAHIRTDSVAWLALLPAAMVPSMAAQHFGDSYEWLLYGDDDTVWFMDSVLDIISK